MRAVHGRAENDAEARELVEALLAQSPEFASLWERHEVTSRAGTLKRLVHPVVGHITLDCQILTSESLTERMGSGAHSGGCLSCRSSAGLALQFHGPPAEVQHHSLLQ